jgi:hypothetical protein
LPIGSDDVASLVLGLDRLDGGGDEASGGAASPGASHLLVRTLFVTKDHPLWNVTSFAANAGGGSSGGGGGEEEGGNNDLPATTTALHGILAAHLASSPSGKASARTGAVAVRLSQAYANPTDASSWVALGTAVACCLELRFSDLVDPNALILGWAQQQQQQQQPQQEDQQQQQQPKGSTVTIGGSAARSLLSVGLGAYRHATTLSLPGAQDEAHSWLWAGAFAEALGELGAAKAHYSQACSITPDAPAPAVRLSRTLELIAENARKGQRAESNNKSSSNKGSSSDQVASAVRAAMEAEQEAERRVRKANALDPHAGTSGAESALQSAMGLLRSGEPAAAIAGFLEVAFRQANAPVKLDGGGGKSGGGENSELMATAVLGLVDGVIATVVNDADAASAATASGGKSAEEEGGDPSSSAASALEEEGAEGGGGAAVFGQGFSSSALSSMSTIEHSPPLLALERLLQVVGDIPARRSAITRLSDACAQMASDAGRKNKASSSSGVGMGSSSASGSSGSGGSDLAVPLAVFNVLLRSLPNASAALPALHSLCVLARDLSLKAQRTQEAVGILRTVLGYLSCTPPDAQGSAAPGGERLDALLDGSLHGGEVVGAKALADLSGAGPALKSHAGAWALVRRTTLDFCACS